MEGILQHRSINRVPNLGGLIDIPGLDVHEDESFGELTNAVDTLDVRVLTVHHEFQGDLEDLNNGEVNAAFSELLRKAANAVESLDYERFQVTGADFQFDPFQGRIMTLEMDLYEEE